VAAPAPGSIFAYMAVTPKGGWFGVLLGIVIATAVTFAVASALLGFGRNEPAEDDLDGLTEDERAEAELEAARARTAENKATSKNQTPATVNREATPREA
jgi:mannitol-specific phosphotransferase system IIBC component